MSARVIRSLVFHIQLLDLMLFIGLEAVIVDYAPQCERWMVGNLGCDMSPYGHTNGGKS